MWVGRKFGRIEHVILAALLVNALDATAVEARKKKSKKADTEETTESKSSSGPGSTSSSSTTTTTTSTSTPAAPPAAAPAAAPAATPAAASTSTTTTTTTSSSAAAPAATAKPAAAPAAAPVAAPAAAPAPAPAISLTPKLELSPQAQNQICYTPKKVMTFQEEALIVPGPVTRRWNAGRVLYGIGTGLSMAATGVASIGGIIVAAGGSTASLSDPGPAMSLAGTVGNVTGTALLVAGLGAQHSALAMLGKDVGRGKYIAGVVFGALGLASVGTGYIIGGMDIPNKDIINYAVGYGGTLLLTTASSILISDARNLRLLWDALGVRPAGPTFQPQPQQQLPAQGQQPSGFPPP